MTLSLSDSFENLQIIPIHFDWIPCVSWTEASIDVFFFRNVHKGEQTAIARSDCQLPLPIKMIGDCGFLYMTPSAHEQ